MKKPLLYMIIGLCIVFGLIFGWYGLRQYFMKQFFAHFAPPPQTISTTVAKAEIWQPYLEAVGTLSAINGVDVSPETDGQVKSIRFTSGEFVKKGQPLFQLDDASERAQLADIQAQLQLADSVLARVQKLYSEKATTKAALDDALSKQKQIKAMQENIQSNISKKLVRAPFDGKIGINQINIGQVVKSGQVCVSLQATKALYAKFVLPQQDIKNTKLKQLVKIQVDSYPNEFFDGYISAIDSKVDENSRTIQLQATIDNSSEKLYPGMFAAVKLFLPSIPNSIVLPQTAITYTLYGDSAFVVTLDGKKDNTDHELGKVKQVFVKTGDKQENSVVILEGINQGDIVANSGQSKLDNGTSVVVNNSNPL